MAILSKHKGNVSATSRSTGIPRPTIIRWRDDTEGDIFVNGQNGQGNGSTELDTLTNTPNADKMLNLAQNMVEKMIKNNQEDKARKWMDSFFKGLTAKLGAVRVQALVDARHQTVQLTPAQCPNCSRPVKERITEYEEAFVDETG